MSNPFGSIRMICCYDLRIRNCENSVVSCLGHGQNDGGAAPMQSEEDSARQKPQTNLGADGQHLQIDTELHMLRMVVDSLPDLIYIKDTQSRFALANRAIRKYMTGSPEGKLLGLDDSAYYPEELAHGFRNDELTVIRTGEQLVSQAERAEDKDGNERWLLTTKVPFVDHDGKVIGIIWIEP